MGIYHVSTTERKNIQYSFTLMSLMPFSYSESQVSFSQLSGSPDVEEMEIHAIRIQHMRSL